MYGMASDGELAYLPISDTPHSFTQPPGLPGGMAALDPSRRCHPVAPARGEADLRLGQRALPQRQHRSGERDPGCRLPASSDGWLRARATGDGEVLWRFDTAQPVAAVNGVEARGGQLHGWPVVAAHGALFVVSGASTQAEPGNALLVFRVPPPH